MAYDYDNEIALGAMVKADEDFRDQHMTNWRRNIQRFAGRGFLARSQPNTFEEWRELFYHKYTSILVPTMTSRNPRVLISTAMPDIFGETAIGLAAADNRWHELTRASETYHELAYDYLLLWAVSIQTSGPMIGGEHDDPWSWPTMTRWSPDMVFWDCDAQSYDKARRAGHTWIIDHDDLVALADEKGAEFGWNTAAVRTLPAMDAHEYADKGWKNTPNLDKGQVVLKDIWFPEVVWSDGDGEALDVAKGINGGTLTIAMGKEGLIAIVRDMQPFYGPRTGPYAIYGYHKVPNDPYPLSPLVAVESSIEDLNTRRISNRDAANKYRRGIVTGGPHGKMLADKIENGGKWWIWNAGATFKRDQMEQIEVGGLTEQMLVAENRDRDELERSSGLTEQAQGNVEGIGTATEVAAAANAAAGRIGGITGRFMVGQADANRAICFSLLLDDTVMVPLGKEHATPEMPNPGWQGGNLTPQQAEALSRFQDPMDALQITVKPYSAAPVTAAQIQQNAQRRMDIALNVAPVMVATPHVKWRETLARIGEANNDDTLPDMIDYEKLAEVQQLAQQAQQTEQEQPQSKLMRGVMGVPAGNAANASRGGVRPANKPKNDMRHMQGGLAQGKGSGGKPQQQSGNKPKAKAG